MNYYFICMHCKQKLKTEKNNMKKMKFDIWNTKIMILGEFICICLTSIGFYALILFLSVYFHNFIF